MKKTITITAALFAIFAGSAFADLVAGWDFSQFTFDGDDDTDFQFDGTTSLNANYSDLDLGLDAFATPGFGGGAAAYGQATWAAPSTFSGYDAINNLGGLYSGQGLVGISTVVGSFDLGPGSLNDGQLNDSAFGIFNLAGDASAITFALTPGTTYDSWAIQLAGITTDGGAGTVALTSSNDGVTFGGPSTTFNLTGSDALYTFDLFGLGVDDSVFVRMVFSSNAVIDNLAVSGTAVPEPSTFAVLLGVVALTYASIRRRK